jgi:hypothetical protein
VLLPLLLAKRTRLTTDARGRPEEAEAEGKMLPSLLLARRMLLTRVAMGEPEVAVGVDEPVRSERISLTREATAEGEAELLTATRTWLTMVARGESDVARGDPEEVLLSSARSTRLRRVATGESEVLVPVGSVG